MMNLDNIPSMGNVGFGYDLIAMMVFLVLVVLGLFKLVNGSLFDSSKTADSDESAVNILKKRDAICETGIEEIHDKNVSTTG